MSSAPPTVLDALGRPVRDLRISVTDRCNYRCSFCMPADGEYAFLPRAEILSFEEVERLARLLARMGVRKIRLTGGEPLLRTELEKLVARLAALDGIEDLALTTNGHLLADKAARLRAAGLGRVTVSLHSLDADRFAQLAGAGASLERVLTGLEAADAAGLSPVKLNAVVMKGVNDTEIVDLARFARDRGYLLRFIEYMDVGTLNRWDPAGVVTAAEVVARIDRAFPLEPLEKAERGEVAERYRYRDGGGELGVIPSVSQPFCGDCTRLRLAADGRLYTCLFAAVGHDLKTPLRQGASDDELRHRLETIWHRRRDRYSEERTEALRAGTFEPAEKVEMFRIGG